MRIGWKCNREEWKNHTGVGDVGLVATEDVLGLAGKVLGARDLLGDVAFVHGDVTMRTKKLGKDVVRGRQRNAVTEGQ
jgi:hypothetical protein